MINLCHYEKNSKVCFLNLCCDTINHGWDFQQRGERMNEQIIQWTLEQREDAQKRFPLLTKFGVTFERGQYLNRKERRKIMATLIPRAAKAMANQFESAAEREETAAFLIEVGSITGVQLGIKNTNDIFHLPTQRS